MTVSSRALSNVGPPNVAPRKWCDEHRRIMDEVAIVQAADRIDASTWCVRQQEGAHRDADHMIDPFVGRRTTEVEEERLE